MNALIFLIILTLGFLAHFQFLTGHLIYYHDSLANLATTHLFFNSLFSGHLPLWSPESNGGQPIWVTTEAYQAFDPIALVVWTIAFLVKSTPVIAHQWTNFLWLFVFALGGMRCARYLNRTPGVDLLVFTILFLGPLRMEMVAQSPGLLLPFRYLPWIIVAFLELTKKPDLKHGMILGTIVGAGASSYQSIYQIPFLLAFALAYRQFPKHFFKFFLVSLIVAMLWYWPTLVACIEMLKLTSLTRTLAPQQFFTVTFAQIGQGLIDFSIATNFWHGHSYIGLIPCALLLCFFVSLKRKISALERAWFVAAVVAAVFGSELIGNLVSKNTTFLGLRNWGSLLTPLALALSQLVAASLERFQKAEIKPLWVLGGILSIGIAAEGIPSSSVFRMFLVGAMVPVLLIPLLLTASKIPKFTYLICLVTALDLMRFSLRPFDAIDARKIPADRFPQFSTADSLFQNSREPKYEYEKSVPFHYEGAAIQKKWVASSDPLLPRGKYPLLTGITGAFELPHSGVTSPVVNYDGSWTIKNFGSTHVTFATNSLRDGLLVYADSYSPDWKAKLDGKAVSVFSENGAKAAFLPKGSHELEFEYSPLRYKIAFWIRAVLLVSGILYILVVGLPAFFQPWIPSAITLTSV